MSSTRSSGTVYPIDGTDIVCLDMKPSCFELGSHTSWHLHGVHAMCTLKGLLR